MNIDPNQETSIKFGEGDDDDVMIIKPLGAGQEVGRSSCYMEFKSKKILFDAGIHPGMSGHDALPFFDVIDCESLDLLLITHFHLDHAGALPWFLEKTAFRGRCFMTHATKAIYRTLLADCIKVSQYHGNEQQLYTEEDLENSFEKIETIDYHEMKDINGVRFWPYVAGHVLGAAMFMVEVAGVHVLYTGDFSRQEDRHLCAAEIPHIRPDVLICESTYGTQLHEEREQREKRFTDLVHSIVTRGGRCLIPAFALGRAQELLLILDEYWQCNEQLHDIPIYYASQLAKKCMAVYQTFVGSMNENIQRQVATNNPFVFKHISNLKSIDHFDDIGPCVVLASPGMLQSGLSRELFEAWCEDPKNGCIIAGYCVEGTLAKQILSEPEEIEALNKRKLKMNIQVANISFSAHTDYRQTSEFIRHLKPPHIVLVHGEMNEMNRLRAAIVREYEDDNDAHIDVYNPANIQSVELHFRGAKTAKVVGQLATVTPKDGDILSGVLVRRNFNYHIMHPTDLASYTELAQSAVMQRQSVFYSGSIELLVHFLQEVAGDVKVLTDRRQITTPGIKKILSIFDGTVLVEVETPCVYLQWAANPVNDMYADAALAAVLQAEANPIPINRLPTNVLFDDEIKSPLDVNRQAILASLLEVCGQEALTDHSAPGEDPLPENIVKLNMHGREIYIDLNTLEIDNCDDESMRHLLSSLLQRTSQCLLPIKQEDTSKSTIAS